MSEQKNVKFQWIGLQKKGLELSFYKFEKLKSVKSTINNPLEKYINQSSELLYKIQLHTYKWIPKGNIKRKTLNFELIGHDKRYLIKINELQKMNVFDFYFILNILFLTWEKKIYKIFTQLKLYFCNLFG